MLSPQRMYVKDFDSCILLLQEAAKRLQDQHIDQWSYWLDPPQDKLEWVRQGIVNGEFYKITDNGQLAAMYRLQENDELYWGLRDDKAYYIHSLVVADSHTGQSIGRQIINQIENQARDHDVFILRLDCNAQNQGLCSYYEKLGFVQVGNVQMPYSLNALYEKKL